MALSLGVHAGSVLKVGDSQVQVISVGPGENMRVSVGDGSQKFNVSSRVRIEVLPEVYLRVGRNSNSNPSPRLCFEAPKAIAITRM